MADFGIKGRSTLSKDQLKRYHPFQSEKGPDPSSEAKKVVAQIARDLGERYGAKKVFLFGSLSRDDQGPVFDIDLAVMGISPARFFKAVAFATGQSRRWKLDLVDVDDCGGCLRDIIEKEGVVLWPEKEPSLRLEISPDKMKPLAKGIRPVFKQVEKELAAFSRFIQNK